MQVIIRNLRQLKFTKNGAKMRYSKQTHRWNNPHLYNRKYRPFHAPTNFESWFLSDPDATFPKPSHRGYARYSNRNTKKVDRKY